jgi:hypothetical protein
MQKGIDDVAAKKFYRSSSIDFCDIEHQGNGAIAHLVKSFINQYFCVDNRKCVLYSYPNITAILFLARGAGCS